MHGILCEICRKRPATSHLLECGSAGTMDLHICNACIAALGLDLHRDPRPVEAIKALSASQAAPGPTKNTFGMTIGINLKPKRGRTASAEPLRCPRCGLGLTEFSKSNRFGCADCYATFHEHLDRVFAEIHHDKRHVGRLPTGCGEDDHRRIARLLHLRKRLDGAIAAEDYEQAALLRDELRAVEEGG